MADFPVSAGPSTQAAPPLPTGAALIVYVLFAVAAVIGVASHGFPLFAPLFGLVGLIAIVVAYVKRSEATGTWLASHFRWLIRTFWWSLLWAMIGGLVLVTLGLVLIGIPIAFAIWAVDTIWVIYRVIRGYLLFHSSQPVPGM
ncbi:MAG: hypothetical protein JSS46_07845 [Proteobacteria bacterium]|jgi:uncharacterized membrane protein|nr:hypothetical protein [Pseudomonadota bacterium]